MHAANSHTEVGQVLEVRTWRLAFWYLITFSLINVGYQLSTQPVKFKKDALYRRFNPQ